jgi:hypothetical protein
VVPPVPVIVIVDNGDAGYAAVGGWNTYNGVGAQGDFDYKGVGSGAATASWTLNGLAPGEYRVSVTWEAFSNRVVDAPYTILDGAAALGTVTIDQRNAPAGFVEDGIAWQDLGVYTLTGSDLSVQLSDDAGPSGKKVIADAVRVERIGAAPLAPEIEVLVGGADVADGTGVVDFGSTLVGTPVTQTITVGNVGTLDLVLDNTINLPGGYSLVAGFGTTLLAPGQTTNFMVQLDASVDGNYGGTISFDSNDANESPFDFSVSGSVSVWVPPAAEIEVLVGGADVADGTGVVDFGSTLVGTPVTRTITVGNVGTLDLALSTAIDLPAGYSLVAGFGTTLLVPGQTTDFVVQLDASVDGSYAGTISFDSNDADEAPFDFSVAGTVSVVPPVPVIVIVDNGDAGYAAVGGWNTYNGAGAQGDFAYKTAGSGTATASWTLNGLTAGQYRVSVTWQAFKNRAEDAPYTVLDGSTPLATVTFDQTQAPADFVEDGVQWQDMGVYSLGGGSVTVQLSDLASPAGRYVIADAVRVERIGE